MEPDVVHFQDSVSIASCLDAGTELHAEFGNCGVRTKSPCTPSESDSEGLEIASTVAGIAIYRGWYPERIACCRSGT